MTSELVQTKIKADSTPLSGRISELFARNFIEYSNYVIKDRAIPDLDDGLKPVQRRILQTLFNMEDGRLHKVANVVGETMKLHPHGDASIFAALVNLANKGYLIDRQGNFGNLMTGDGASAARYIECRLSALAKEILFNKDLTVMVDSYDGRMQEPVTLPAKIPLLLLQGAEGIAVGMATKILPHNFSELLTAQKDILRGRQSTVYPDFVSGGILDVSDYQQGNGRLRCRARIVERDEKTIVITEIPYGTTTESIMESIEKAVRTGRIKIASVNDYTAENVEIEIVLGRGVYAKETIPALYAYTDCEIAITPSLTVIRDNTPAIMIVDEVLHYNTEKLTADLKKELVIEHGRLQEKLHAFLLERIFIEERLYKRIEESPSYEAVVVAIDEALKPYHPQLIRPVIREDIERLLELQIKRISRYDLEKKQREIEGVKKEIERVEKHLANLVKYTISCLDGLLKKFGPLFPRRTEIQAFQGITARDVAKADLLMGYDQAAGFLGHGVKDTAGTPLICSEFDKILVILRDGRYKVINVPEKLFVGPDLVWFGRVEEQVTFNLIYRDGRENLCYVKRFSTPRFILDKEYRLFAAHEHSLIELLQTGPGCRAKVFLRPSKRSKASTLIVSFDDLPIRAPSAVGKRVSTRMVRRIDPLIKEGDAGLDSLPQMPSLFPIPSE